ncbi:MAG: xanthine dehydrogenase accessory protein XdhC [Hyphomicrobiales bacterium]|nr:xanthine dehydrogenase accessory protein XdhC [Hyphomicrobiales bacterium]
MKVWAHIAKALEAHGTCAMISVVKVEGSTPREAGARIVVTPLGFHGTIGGGTLEWQAIAKAQALLGKPTQHKLSDHSLGPDLGQCCGGRVQLVTEVLARSDLAMAMDFAAREESGVFAVTGRILAPDFSEKFGDSNRKLYLFGAGHVGRALILALAPLPFDVIWIDPREGAFPSAVPSNVVTIQSGNPAAEIADAPPGSFALVMTHSHALDLEIIDTILRSPSFAYAGLIGSATKRARFSKRLREAGVAENRIEELVCPIGIPSIKSKHPSAIAAATAVQLLERDEAMRCAESPLAGPLRLDKVGAGRRAS